MNVSKRGNVYRCFEAYTDSLGRYRKVSVTIKKNTPQERKKALELLRKKMENPSAGVKLKDLIDYYIEDQKRTCKATTWSRNEATLNRILRVFGDVDLGRLSAGYCRTHLLKLSDNPATYNEYRRRLSSMVRWAYQNDYLDNTACIDKLQRLPDASPKSKVSNKFLEAEELKKVLSAMPEHYRYYIEFLALSGLRIGEFIALDNDDVSNEIKVNKTYDHRHKIITSPKTPDSLRSVHIQPELASCISKIRRQSNLNRLLSGQRCPYFAVSLKGDRLSYIALSRAYRAICEEQTGKRLSLHSLRHTHVALMAEHVPLDAIARRLGHSDSRITKEIYYHVTQKQKEIDNAQFDAVSLLK